MRTLQKELESRNSRIQVLENEVRNQSQQNQALTENIDQYEEQIAYLERKMKENLRKEARRRHKIEYDLARYKVTISYIRTSTITQPSHNITYTHSHTHSLFHS
jgi:cell division septum initiation protein DivIVA